MLILVFIGIAGLAIAQDKPRVFVQGKGSQDVTTSGAATGGRHWGSWGSRSTVDSHDEGMEVAKDLQKDCSGVTITLNQSNADYIVMLNRESKHNRGLLRTNSQIQVANRLGDILGTNATRTVGNASKNACQLILADWNQHGRMAVQDSPTSAPVVAPVAPTAAPVPAGEAKAETVSAIQSLPSTKADHGGGSLGDAATNASNPARSTGEAIAEISSDPFGADIEIDGNFVGSTPSSVGIVAGDHTLRISRNGYKRWERPFKSSTGNIKVAAVLEPIPGDSAGTAHVAAEIRQDANPSPGNQYSPSASGTAVSRDDRSAPIATATSTTRDPNPPANLAAGLAEEALIGVWFTGNPTVRHDGVEVSGVQPKGPADNIDIKPGDVILAIDGHFLFTIDELRTELLRHEPGARLTIRYRHNRLTSENYLTLGSKDAVPRR
jgi:hypothetical protein